MTLYDAVQNVSKKFPNHYAVNLYGTLQKAGGIKGAEVGKPVLS